MLFTFRRFIDECCWSHYGLHLGSLWSRDRNHCISKISQTHQTERYREAGAIDDSYYLYRFLFILLLLLLLLLLLDPTRAKSQVTRNVATTPGSKLLRASKAYLSMEMDFAL